MRRRFTVRRGLAVRATVLTALLTLAACLLFAGGAMADGDPGSDVLLDQNLFAAWDANLSTSQQLHLGQLLNETSSAGAPIRVAIVARQDDLGTVTPLWLQPQDYAQYLGYELSLAYNGRVLVVMPNGYGVYWHANPAGASKLAAALRGHSPGGDSAAELVAGTTFAVRQIEASAGISAAKLAQAGTGTASTQAVAPASGPAPAQVTHKPATRSGSLGVVLAILVIVALTLYIAVRSGRLNGLRARRAPRAQGAPRALRFGPMVAVPIGLVGVLLLALVINQSGPSTPGADALATNPYIDPGTEMAAQAAPGFTLTDETGKRVSLSQYRGKVVVLSFVDSECQTICPLTTQAMLYAKSALGRAGKDVQLLGINANWKSTQVDDVLNYTELHGLTGQWHFLTGDLKQLSPIWTAYHVNEKALDQASNNEIEHIAATFIVDPQGRLRYSFTTYPSYAAVGQFGERIAQDAAKLLPGHVTVGKGYSYATIPGVTPSQTTTLAKLGGGRQALGPGAPHLYLFFATWDQQTTPISGELDALDGYAAAAKKDGLPGLTAIDEGSVEPSSQALPEFVKSLPEPLSYPVAIDSTGQVADGYEVQGEPWFVLTNAAGKIVWYQEVYTSGWPDLQTLVSDVRGSLKGGSGGLESNAEARALLAGSPPRLAALHRQSSLVLGGGEKALAARIAALRGYPVVVNIWASWCAPCQKEFTLLSQAAAHFGKRVAFIGADVNDKPQDASAFLRSHPVSYPSYAVSNTDSLNKLVIGGIAGTPETLFVNARGRAVQVQTGSFASLGSLEQDINDAALGSG